ncbi:ATP-binding cassette domain-containing protein [Streptomyces lycii]|uniref:ATP-binding cassette domain-containing protein n=1 Tax=Streptomyces lycii TaxID=2654337 RepID=A0ABQ7FEK2_9ACTN|nr:ATP-binding cassette domain-containing protein [Streptomyces lycii]KAF4407469.1 ATP-binding cassette domain-containing protein [Streptomyces lycii]
MNGRGGHTGPAVRVAGLVKRYGRTEALRGVDLVVERGSVVGVLGPNGAGKTTLVRILATLVRPDGGTAEVFGYDVLRHPGEVRRRVGLTGQFAAVDELLTGEENLVLIGRLAGMDRGRARRRADELLNRFGLRDAAGRTAQGYSGGMRRRLDLAAGLMTAPPLVVLDEPTTGLDPRSRVGLWEVIEELAAEGSTVLLTSQYLEEVDRLAHHVMLVDAGEVAASGSPEELKDRLGAPLLVLTLGPPGAAGPGARWDAAARVLSRYAKGAVDVSLPLGEISCRVAAGARVMPAVARDLDDAGITPDDMAVRRATLDDVFLALTGQPGSRAPAAPAGTPAGPGTALVGPGGER